MLSRVKIKLRKSLLHLLFIISLLLNFYFFNQVKSYKESEGKYRVREVLDGDSFIIDLDQTVRLANVNAPDLEFCYGKEAKENLEKLILGKYVRIERSGRDNFGRILGIVWMDKEFVNGLVVKNGWARYESGGSEEGKYREEKEIIKKLAEEAQQKGIGLWSPLCYQKENLEDPKCVIKGNIGKSYKEKTYHLPGCSEYERTVVEKDLGEQWFCTEQEAIKAGYRKSEHCF